MENRSNIEKLIGQGNYLEAASLLKNLLIKNKNDGNLISKLAGVYIESGRVKEAKQTVDKLVELYPIHPFTKYLQARVQYMTGNLPKVISILENNIQSNLSNCSDEITTLNFNLLANAYGILGNCNKSTEYYLQASRYAKGSIEKAIDYSNYLFHLNYLTEITQDALYKAHLKYDSIYSEVKQYIHPNVKKAKRKIRIGYISSDFRQHVVTCFSYALFSNYDKNNFEVICFSNGKEDRISGKIRELVDQWINICHLNVGIAAKIIYEQGIDILVDLSGHTKNNCLPIMAHKPAPIQMSGIGYFNTTGLKTIDYFITDVYCDPIEQNDEYFTEKLLRLPQSHFCYTPLYKNMPTVSELPLLENKYITFGSFNNFTKVNNEVLLLWKEILVRVPNSILLLKSSILGNQCCLPSIKSRFEKLGLPLERIKFRPETYPYLHEYNDIDIALDTFPYPGGGTTCDALYMGVPVITLVGNRHGSRFGFSILKNIGLEELAAKSKAEYVNIVVSLANDVELLNGLRKNLRTMMKNSNLMNQRQYINNIEAQYKKIYYQFGE